MYDNNKALFRGRERAMRVRGKYYLTKLARPRRSILGFVRTYLKIERVGLASLVIILPRARMALPLGRGL